LEDDIALDSHNQEKKEETKSVRHAGTAGLDNLRKIGTAPKHFGEAPRTKAAVACE
jgi:hypothetical protein